MATLSAISLTLAGGVSVFAVTLGLFSVAVLRRNIFVAGRCVARPRDVIYNPNPKHPSQNRGRTIFGWMGWAMSLTYDTMLSGVPGTGTRNGGLKGQLLRVNLDGIVLLRFHHMGLRVCCLATILYLAVVMPLYSTAHCSKFRGDFDAPECQEYNLTDYQKLTLANIPILETDDDNTSLLRYIDIREKEFLGRLYAVVLCVWIVTWYALSQLHLEWLDILAMRRVYYLEANHWDDRVVELETIADAKGKEDETHIANRAVWVPHPELRDTVPNIELYSVLVGGLPSLPTEAMEDLEAVFSRKQSMDWQLSVTTAFFDHCVPNQPGFSSSVAAVTILPAAAQLTDAWKQWYKAAAKLRRLRFIRRRIGQLRDKNIAATQLMDGDDLEQGPPRRKSVRKASLHNNEVLGSETDLEVENHLFHALDFGPEQSAVYGREFAQGAANFAPNGWFEWRIKNASLKELIVLETAAAEAVNEANVELQEARDRIADSSDGSDGSAGSSSMDEVSLDSKDVKTLNGGTRQESEDGSCASFSNDLDCSRSSSQSNSRSLPKRLLSASLAPGKQSPSAYTNSESTDTFAERTFEGFEAYDVPLKDNFSPHADTRSVASSSGRKSKFLSRIKPGTKRFSKASLDSAQLPAGLGLEAGLWREQRKLSMGSSQHIPRASKSKSRMSNAFKRRKSNDAEVAQRRASNDGDIIKRRYSNDGEFMERRMSHSHTVEITSGNKSRRPELRRAQSSDDILLSEPSLRDFEGEKTNTQAAAGLEGKYDKDEKDTENHGDQGLDKPSIWEILAKDKQRKEQLRARLYSIKGLEDPITDTKEEMPMENHSDGPSLMSYLPAFPALWTGSDKSDDDSEESQKSRPSEDITQERKAVQIGQPKATFAHNEVDTKPTSRRSVLSESNGSFTAEILNAVGENEEIGENLEIAYTFEQRAGLRKREAASARRSDNKTEKWYRVMSIVQETSKDMNGSEDVKERMIGSGQWKMPTFQDIMQAIRRRVFNCFYRVKFRLKPPEILDDFARDSTYAVVTFTSRQAAVAARHCLGDARGADRWVNLQDLPTPPLADAPSCGTSCRGCVRPVTLSISETQKKIRHFVALLALATIYFFYTKPLTAAQNLVSAERLSELYPEIKQAQQADPFMANLLLGFIPAVIWILFFAICPPLFKLISNFGSNATSSVKAENSALHYFWWFMVVSAFTGTSFETAVVDGFDGGVRIGAELQELLEKTATAIPLRVSANWLNWMIARMFIVLPTQYLLQMNTFLFTLLGLKCCQRAVRGGGAGPPIPYRIYVDSGVVMLCLFALAPASPLIAPAAFVYFLLCIPLLRWTMIFLYRPKFDIGGARFPFIFDVCISGMVVGQILLTTMMAMKRATGPAVGAVLPLLPTIFYRYKLRRKYLRSFEDAALLQTSLLDGWDVDDELPDDDREDFRTFLVDCHKAAYVPVCIASGDARTLITAEPAVVIPLDFDVAMPQGEEFAPMEQIDEELLGYGPQAGTGPHLPMAHQPGKIFRRASIASRIPNVSPDSPMAFPLSASQPTVLSPQPARMMMRASFASRTPKPDLASPVSSPMAAAKPSVVPVLSSSANQPGRMMRRASLASRMQRFTPLSPVPSHLPAGSKTLVSTLGENRR